MSWQLHVPHRRRSDTLAGVAEAARALPAGEERAIARQLALGALIDGTAASAGGREQLAEHYRPPAGFPS